MSLIKMHHTKLLKKCWGSTLLVKHTQYNYNDKTVIHTFHTHSVAVVHAEDVYCSYISHTLTSTVTILVALVITYVTVCYSNYMLILL